MRMRTTFTKTKIQKDYKVKTNCYKELKNKTFINQNLIIQWRITREST